jgi:hypothetical protein
MMLQPHLLAGLLCGALALLAAPAQDVGASEQLEAALAEQGVRFDLEARRVSFPARVCIREDLLEYVLVGEHGASHESLFLTSVSPTVLNASLLALGARPGTNVRWVPRDPPPTEEELRDGAPTHDVLPPEGDGFYLYAAWKEGGEEYFFRIEDLVTNLERGRSMQRHAWVYLGSRLVPSSTEEGAPEVLAAEMEGNLVNLSYFRAGNTLFSAALDACVQQTIWLPNAPLLPAAGAEVVLVASREPLRALPEAVAADLVELAPR